jgi:cell division protein FtsB
MRRSAAEENKSKQREIQLLKDDITRLNASRDDALEAQRRDLTQTFENLLKQREESFIQKERDIAAQVTQLDSRFEQLQTENVRLKSEVSDLHRRNEMLSEEVSAKEENLRQLQWRIDDERMSRQEAEDATERRLQQLSLDLTLEKDKSGRLISDLQHQLEKVSS